jgi:23S rRNA-/tRNA-specific pseudouridylate synthase
MVYGIISKSFEERCFLSAIQPHSGRVNVMKNGGKSSHTIFQVLETFPKHHVSLVNCSPITGRSHQIRVHLEKNLHSIVGDKVYGEGKRKPLAPDLASLVQHQLLHARSIKLLNKPNGEMIEVVAPYPKTFSDFLERARLPETQAQVPENFSQA